MEITAQIIKEHNLCDSEYQRIVEILGGRTPTITELGIASAMFSEHCSYKSTKKWLKTMHTKAPWVICGPGENAGIIDIGDEDALIFKMESHNHPSFIEPYQGAATGVGGILRDVFTMGARPIANLNALRFGNINHPKTRQLINGVVAGVAGYGNCVGVPTVGGQCDFDDSYNGNILVNAMTIGLVNKNKIFYSAANHVGASVLYVGSKTGRDGINGAVMASDEFSEGDEDKRPTVQVGDPFVEKLLIEACLELMQQDCILSIQDMGAAGLTSSSFEMASKGNSGIELNLEKVPMREKGMIPYELMLSESQERMLMVVQPGKEQVAQDIFNKWNLDCAIIGKVTDSGNVVVKMNGEIYANIPAQPLSDSAPEYDRPWVDEVNDNKVNFDQLLANSKTDIAQNLQKMLENANLASKKALFRQYDSQVMNDTIDIKGDSAIVRIHGTNKALATSVDCTPRYVFANPFIGGMQAVVETYRNISASGAKPLAITNCLNFGNPQKKEIMGQIVMAIKGINEACRKLNYPVISGNVSLYNETDGSAIKPTPAIGGVGLLYDYKKRAKGYFDQKGDKIYVIGKTQGDLNCSIFASEVLGIKELVNPPKVDLDLELKHAKFIRNLIVNQIIKICGDISDGGILVKLFEMLSEKELGAKLNLLALQNAVDNFQIDKILFGEDQGRYIVGVNADNEQELLKLANQKDIEIFYLGQISDDKNIALNGFNINVGQLKEKNQAILEDIFKI